MRIVFNRSAFAVIRDALLPIVFTVIIMAMLIYGMDQAATSSSSEGLRVLREGAYRAAVKCYAVEGSYPDTLQYMEDHYGLFIDKDRYVVHYDVFASNMQPSITVIPLRQP